MACDETPERTSRHAEPHAIRASVERTSALSRIAVGVLIWLGACGGPPTVRMPELHADQCTLATPPHVPADTIRVMLMEPVDLANAPYGTNPSEDLVFAHVYEGLTYVNCLGDVVPAVAEAWHTDETGTRWTFHLDVKTRFSDGRRVTAADIAALFESSPITSSIDSAVAVGDRELRMYVKRPHHHMPPREAAQLLAAKEALPWPLGSGPIVPAEVQRNGSTAAVVRDADAPATGPVVSFIENDGADPRDVLAGPIHLVITSDPSATDYASRQDRFTVTPLPWDARYVLVSRSRFELILDGGIPASIASDELDALARDAVRADARGAAPDKWWNELERCDELAAPYDSLSSPGAAEPNTAEPTRHGLVVYDESDGTARDLAARIVALGADPAASGRALRAAVPELGDERVVAADGVGVSELARRLGAGTDFLYLLRLPHAGNAACSVVEDLLNRAPWLKAVGVKSVRAVLPLVETRRHAIIDASRVGAVVDGFGRVHLKVYREEDPDRS